MKLKKIILLLAILPGVAFAQVSKKDSLWQPFGYFLGDWTGHGSGEPGEGDYTRNYTRLFGKQFIEVRNKAVYPPGAKNPKGETHEDLGILSFDGTRKKFMLTQFHTEGFVNTYLQHSISADHKTIVFVTEHIQNIPAGYRARETYQISGPDEFSETFEIAEPGKDFEVYTKTLFKRVGAK